MGQGLSEKEFCRQKPYIPGCKKYLNGGGSKPFPCCRANNAKCLSCVAGLTEEEYCKKNPSTGGCEKYRNCCQAYNAKCESCKQGISEEEFCKNAPTDFFGGVQGCEKYHNGYQPRPCCLSGHCNENACNGLTYEEGGRGDFSAKCISCDLGISVEEFCRTKQPEGKTMEGCEEFCKKKKNRDVPGCEKYHKGDGGKGCCKANTADCLACSEGKSVERFCKKKRNRDVPGCEKNHRRGSWGKNDRDDSRQQGDGGFRNWFG